MKTQDVFQSESLRVRPYRATDQARVSDLFRDETMSTPGGAYPAAMGGLPFHPSARTCYATFIVGLFLAIAAGWRHSWVGGAISVAAVYRFWKTRRGIRLMFEAYVRDGVDGDLKNVPATYGLRESGQGDYICDTAKGFWVIVMDTPRSCDPSGELIVGTIGLDYGPTKSSGLLRRLVVASGYQRRGIGTRLFDIAIAHARSHGMTSLHLTTSEWHYAGRALYKKYGFKVIRSRHWGPVLLSDYRMDL